MNQATTNRQMTPFQSTPSAWRVTSVATLLLVDFVISIHTLRVEGDLIFCVMSVTPRISIHTLRVEGDRGSSFMV